ncbi:MAG TPA: GumC family protein [Pyrinomonadaceae bacterium]|nr:GumC family protein [Pyrinomonadaceae bacterium]
MNSLTTQLKVEQARFSMRDVASVWFRHKLLIIVTFLMIAAGTAVVTMLIPNEYESRMKILVKGLRTEVPITPERTGGAIANVSDNSVTEAQINSEIELLTSKDLLNQVAKEAGLDRHGPSLMERWGLKAPAKTPGMQVELAAEKLGKDLVVTPVKKANIVEVSYSSSSPQVAAVVLQKLQELYLDKHLKLHRLPGTYEFFKQQAEQYEQQLRGAEAHLSDFQRSMNVVSLTQQKDLTVQKMTESRSKLLETESFLHEVNDRIEQLQEQMRTLPARIVTQSRALPNQYSAERLNTMLVELRNRRTQLLTKFRSDDRLVREVDKQIETTKAALDRASGQTATEQATDLNPLRQSLESELAKARIDRAGALARHSSLSGQVQDYDNQLSRLESITGQYQDLTRRVKESEENYQLYEKKREESRIADELDQSKITNVSLAEAPVESHLPTKPNRPLNLFLGIVLGVLISVAAAIAAEFTRGNVETPQELELLSGSQVLATIPKQGRDRRSLIIDKRRLLTVGNPPPEFVSEVNE